MAKEICKLRIELQYSRNRLQMQSKALKDHELNSLAEKLYHAGNVVQEIIDQLIRIDEDDCN